MRVGEFFDLFCLPWLLHHESLQLVISAQPCCTVIKAQKPGNGARLSMLRMLPECLARE